MDINMTVKVAEELADFMDTIREIGITVDDVREIGKMFPDVTDSLEAINNWRQGLGVVSETVPKPEKKPVPETIIPTPIPTPTTKKYKRLNNAVAESIAKIVEEKYLGRAVKKVSTDLSKKFDYPSKTIEKFLKKQTYREISDKYFLTVNDIIKPLEATDIFTDNPADIKRIEEILNQHNNDVMVSITDKMTRNDIIRFAVVRWNMFVTGKLKDLGSGVKEIFCMEAIHNNPKSNNKAVAAAIKKKYNIDVSESIVSAVRNGKSYKNLRRL